MKSIVSAISLITYMLIKRITWMDFTYIKRPSISIISSPYPINVNGFDFTLYFSVMLLSLHHALVISMHYKSAFPNLLILAHNRQHLLCLSILDLFCRFYQVSIVFSFLTHVLKYTRCDSLWPLC